jgi:ADP-ribose pyrophosphatase YjhB (NUDIX family)
MQYQQGVAAFLIENDNILLLERGVEPFKGFWEVPAGKCEPGETFEQAIEREVLEETDLNIKIIREIGVNINEQYKFESHLFIVERISGELKNTEPDKHLKVAFIPLNNLPDNIGASTRKGLQILGL